MLHQSLVIEPPTKEPETNEIKMFNIAIKSKMAKLVTPDGEEINIPISVLTFMQAIVDILAHGNALTLIPMEQQLTTQQAADLLNVSRPFLIKLLERGEIPYEKIGTHRRVLMADLISYKQQRDRKRRQKLNELTELSQELEMYD